MTSLRHIGYFIALGLFWGISPSLYKAWADIGMPPSHVIVLTGIGVGIALVGLALWRYGSVVVNKEIQLYGMGCALLMNIPFATSLTLAAYVPPTEMALAISSSPLVSYALALVTGREEATPRRLAAILMGFISTAVLILTRGDGGLGDISIWHVAAFSLPLLYAFYNWFTSVKAPPAADIYSLGAAESFWSGLLLLPVALLFAPPWAASQLPLGAYWTVGIAGLMWIVERIAYFTLIREAGAVYTIQATYVSTPTAVIIAAIFFGGAQDKWLWVSLVFLMAALYLNNSGNAKPQAATQPSA